MIKKRKNGVITATGKDADDIVRALKGEKKATDKGKTLTLPIKLSDNLSIEYYSPNRTEEGILQLMYMECTFFGQTFEAFVSKKSIDNGFGSITGEGPTELFDSFISMMEDVHWDTIKTLFAQMQQEISE